MAVSETGLTFLCISSYYKGSEFLKSCKQQGNRVFFLTSSKLKDEPWPYDHIDETFYLNENAEGVWEMKDMIGGVAWLMRSKKIDRIVALDDFDVEKAALLREEFRIPGMGQTTARYFRDKLAMRMQANDAGIAVPPFVGLFNDEAINEYLGKVEGPWLIKPRGEASATGIKKVHNAHEFWEKVHELGDRRHQFLAEQFRPGDVYHVDALSYDGKIVFCKSSRYLNTPMEVAHGGGVFRSVSLPDKHPEAKQLKALTGDVMRAFGMQFSASHTEWIKSRETGEFIFLETASRVGGAHLSDMVEASTAVNLWVEWAALETKAALKQKYTPPKSTDLTAGIIVSLARQQQPDQSVFNAPEICWRMRKEYHIGFIMKSQDDKRLMELMNQYTEIVFRDFNASAPVPDKPTH
jgi:hypothetical protein